MQNLFDQQTFKSISERINRLSPSSARQWGKMNVAQMMAHCRVAFDYPISNEPAPRMFMGYLVGWIIKPKIFNDEPFRKNLPTAPVLKFANERDFESEKSGLLKNIETFYSMGPGNAGKYPHPMFGSLTAEQWGKFMYKHLDHHLQQFGV
ncbi:MAG: DUF1569 domain-containing protein [Ferruginibacter sp.]